MGRRVSVQIARLCSFTPAYEFEIIDEDGNALIEEA